MYEADFELEEDNGWSSHNLQFQYIQCSKKSFLISKIFPIKYVKSYTRQKKILDEHMKLSHILIVYRVLYFSNCMIFFSLEIFLQFFSIFLGTSSSSLVPFRNNTLIIKYMQLLIRHFIYGSRSFGRVTTTISNKDFGAQLYNSQKQ